MEQRSRDIERERFNDKGQASTSISRLQTFTDQSLQSEILWQWVAESISPRVECTPRLVDAAGSWTRDADFRLQKKKTLWAVRVLRQTFVQRVGFEVLLGFAGGHFLGRGWIFSERFLGRSGHRKGMVPSWSSSRRYQVSVT